MALTASATPEVQAHIIEGLQLRPDHLFLTQSFNRPNLHYSVRKKPGGSLPRTIAEYIQENHPGKAGVIYCTGRDTCERVAKDLRGMGLKARHYHAKMVDGDKQKTLQDWKDGLSDIIVATVSHAATYGHIHQPDPYNDRSPLAWVLIRRTVRFTPVLSVIQYSSHPTISPIRDPPRSSIVTHWVSLCTPC